MLAFLEEDHVRLKSALITAVAVLAFGASAGLAQAAPPSGVSAVALGGKVDLAWQPAAGATEYTVYRGTTATSITTPLTPFGTLVGFPPPTSFTDSTVVNGTTYYYAVRAVVGGVESANSLAVQAKPVAPSCTAGNPVVVENCFPGNAGWGLKSAASVSAGGIEGFATAQSIDKGQSVDLKVNSANSTTFNVEIYRTGYYGGAGARLFATMRNIPGTAQTGCTSNDSTGLYECSAWSVSTSVSTTASWPSGMYVLRIVRNDNSNDNLILLAVRDDARHPDLLYGSSFTTFQAYNNYGGRSLYDFNSCCGNTVTNAPRAAKVSFDRPFNQTLDGQRDWYTKSEIATVYWLEQEGYDVGYASNSDLELHPAIVGDAKAYVSPAHDEYWSGGMHDTLVQARDAGVNAFFTGSNEVYWKIRFEPSPTGAPAREQVTYKSTQSGGADPSGIPTGTWRDPAGVNQPENSLSGVMYVGDRDFAGFPLVVSAAQGADRVWRYTGLDSQAPGSSVSIGSNLVGWEWDARVANGAEPAGTKTLAASPVTGNLIQNFGKNQTPGSTVSTMVKYKAASGATVVTTGTNWWNRGLARNPSNEGEPDLRIQQATTNILADMSALPATPPGDIKLDGAASGPVAPGGVSAAVTGTDSIRISWNAVAGATGYNVYRTTTPRDGGLPLGSRANSTLVSGTTTFTDTGLSSATAYSYVVTTVTAGAQSAASSEVTATTLASSTDPTRINAGGGAVTSVTGASFRADSLVTGGQTYATNQPISGTNDQSLYQDERWGQFTYAIPVANGTYDVRMHFAELYYGTAVSGCAGKRIFSMDVLNTTLSPDIKNLDICATVGVRTALVRTVSGVSVTNGTLSIKSVYGSVDDPEITAIEVVPASTGPAAPAVTTMVPASGATGVATTAKPAATFSRAMDPATLTAASFKLTPAGGSPVPASVSYDGPTSTATLTPSAPMAYSTTYAATVTTAAKASDGTPLAADASWTFTTGPPPDTTGPAVAISAPADGATVLGTTSVTATATDASGVAGVQFKLDGVNLGAEDTTSPYSTSWNTTTATNGTHTLTAVARDTLNNTSNATTVTVTVNNPPPDTTGPAVAISAPADGATVLGTTSVTATATDASGVAGVQFKLDGVNLGAEDTTSPYSTSWNTTTVTNGTHTLTAVARDTLNNTSNATTVTVTVNNPPPDTTGPAVAISAPADGATVLGTTSVTATATDASGVAGVQFKLDGVNLGAEDTTSPYSTSWNTTTVTNGTHTLTAVARDTLNNTSTATTVTVTVSNPVDTQGPTVSITAPANGATIVGTTTVTATATDASGVAGVQFKLDGADLGAEDTTSPYSTSWNTTTVTNGTHTLTAVARDTLDNASTATTVTVTVNNDNAGPVTAITAPVGGSTVTGSATVTATATDTSGVAGVQFKLDGANLGAEDTTSPYSVAWDTTSATNGSHSLTAVARDTLGNTTTTATVTVTVSNVVAPPGVTLLGNTVVEPNVDYNVAGQAEAFKTTGLAAGALTTLKLYLDASSTATKVVVGVYADNASHPGALIGQATIAAPLTGAWNTVTVPSAPLASGSSYWIAVLGPSGSGVVRFRDRGRTAGAAETSSQTTLTTLPPTWTRGSSYTDGPLSAYGTS